MCYAIKIYIRPMKLNCKIYFMSYKFLLIKDTEFLDQYKTQLHHTPMCSHHTFVFELG